MSRKKKICVVVSTIITAQAFLRDQLTALADQYDVFVVANESNPAALRDSGIPLDVVFIPIVREIHLLKDIKALCLLISLFRRERFDLIHSVTPKAGLLTALAGWLARAPLRVHTYTGQVWVTRTGVMRNILKSMDMLIARLNQVTLTDSTSQKQFLVEQRVVREDRCKVPAKGSISGVDIARFRPNPKERAQTRHELGLTETDVLFLFLGRLNIDKGLLDLAEAFRAVRAANQYTYLLVAGPDEANLCTVIQDILQEHRPSLILRGYTNEPEKYMRAADVFCLPSYREGFGTVVIEAAACGTPAVASRIYGLTDAISDGVTGLLHEAGNIQQISLALSTMASDQTLRKTTGAEALKRARKLFSMEFVTREMLTFYEECLSKENPRC